MKERMKPKAYIFDIDGTCADCTHRLHFIKPTPGMIHFPQEDIDWAPDWDSFFDACKEDKPIEPILNIARALGMFSDAMIILVTGRPERCRQDTWDWLEKNNGPIGDNVVLFMRQDGDHRPDHEIKEEIYERKIKDKYEVIGVFEDRDQCVNMWRRLGLTCLQVAPGNY